MSIRPLGAVKEIVEAAGMGISYAYEDLVFLKQNSFLLQFGDNDSEVIVHVNTDADEAIVRPDITRLQEIALDYEIRFIRGIRYILSQDDGENIRLEFSKDDGREDDA